MEKKQRAGENWQVVRDRIQKNDVVVVLFMPPPEILMLPLGFWIICSEEVTEDLFL